MCIKVADSAPDEGHAIELLPYLTLVAQRSRYPLACCVCSGSTLTGATTCAAPGSARVVPAYAPRAPDPRTYVQEPLIQGAAHGSLFLPQAYWYIPVTGMYRSLVGF
jgi:hypothetical protein